ncbi:MAG TPA: class I lanthipeptide [Thermoanaerobaculia bacterium]|jgi:hypothetical protein|nr:class I lanthipeptide [Thermoanaerobaculia bacterium]
MKKHTRKLSLHRETLRHLQSNNLQVARGGTANTNEILTTCACTDTCGSCQGCGTGTGTGGTSNTCTQELITTCVC